MAEEDKTDLEAFARESIIPIGVKSTGEGPLEAAVICDAVSGDEIGGMPTSIRLARRSSDGAEIGAHYTHNGFQGWGYGAGQPGEREIQKVRIGTMAEGRWASLVRGEHPHSRSDRDYYVRESSDQDPVAFSGHRLMHEITFEDRNYLKDSYLSGDEFRGSGTCTIKINGNECDSFQYRDIDSAIAILPAKLARIKNLFLHLWDEGERCALIGRRIYYRGVPAVVLRLSGKTATIRIDHGDEKFFPLLPYQQEDKKEAEARGEEFMDLDRLLDESGHEVITDTVFSDEIWWHRS